MSRRAVIVGSGLGGLATALRLSALHWNVTVFEAGSTFGGKMNRFSQKGFTFDTGPSLLTMPWVFADLFRAAGSRIEDHVRFSRLEQLAEYVFADGVRFAYTSSLPEWLSTLQRVAPQDRGNFFRFMELGARMWQVSRSTFLARSPYERPSGINLKALAAFPVRDAFRNYDRAVAEYFHSTHLRQLFNRYPTYVGSSPYLAPGTLAIIPYLEFAYGGWYCHGGLYRIVEALTDLAQAQGVTLCRNTAVRKIRQTRGRVSGVQLESGEEVPADVVVMNGDAAALPGMLDKPAASGASSSMSGFVLLLGIDHELPDLQANTVLFSADYVREFDQIFRDRQFPDEPTVYVNAPSRLDRSLVPYGRGEALFVMANAPARTDNWGASDIESARGRVFAKMRSHGIVLERERILVEDVWTPKRIEQQYSMPGGSIYGIASHGWRNTVLRPRNKSNLCDGLYLVGGSTHPGGGTPTVLLSAEITCNLIRRHEAR